MTRGQCPFCAHGGHGRTCDPHPQPDIRSEVCIRLLLSLVGISTLAPPVRCSKFRKRRTAIQALHGGHECSGRPDRMCSQWLTTLLVLEYLSLVASKLVNALVVLSFGESARATNPLPCLSQAKITYVSFFLFFAPKTVANARRHLSA